MLIDIKRVFFLTPELTIINPNKFKFNQNQKSSLTQNTQIQ